MFSLKNFRENNLKMTQDDFAKMVGTRQDVVSRWEKNPEQISLDNLRIIAEKCGITIDQLVKFKKNVPTPLNVKNTWRIPAFTKNAIIDYIDHYLLKTNNSLEDNSIISDLQKRVKNISKPKIAIIGRSDVGKSALINALIGTEKMPTSWTPTTSIVVYITNISDRPKYIEEDVWIFKDSVGKEKGWDYQRLEDEEYCRTWKLASGSADILYSYGTRQGECFDKNEAGSAVVFVESSLLDVCEIIDLPGFGTGDRIDDDLMTLKVKRMADILVYMSISNGFMRSEDIEYIKESIQNLTILENDHDNIKPLSNLFIVASQAHIVNAGNKQTLNKIMDEGCERLVRTMPNDFWKRRSLITKHEYTKSDIRKRFFTYTTDIDDLRQNFNQDLCSIVESLPLIINEQMKTDISSFAESASDNLKNKIKGFVQLTNEREKYIQLLAKIKENEPKRTYDNQNRRKDLQDNISILKRESITKFQDKYKEIINIEHIVSVIEQCDFKNKKDDRQALGSYLNSQLQTVLQDTIESNTKIFNNKINEYIAAYKKSVAYSEIPGISVNMPPFDVTRAFASGLAGLATFGALTFWASTFGNLGAYILVTKGVSVLSALGISIGGGTATATAAIASIGGPIVLGISLAVIVGISVFAFFSGGWKKSIAKKIVAEYVKNNVLDKYCTVISNYWQDTEIAFNASADKLEVDWGKYIDNLSELINNYDIEDIKHKLEVARSLKSFFDHIPL
ncbi:dynamin family protein [Megasphaera paucivorans]|uniref:Helix-turn-helix n=1 Tax=Megasphaera paucivorans TaxID=349095 RepID=A0A1G9U9A9_9FIRM|nr:dynamin family protein [Megasphaera paucivorans]SDM56413.1 Helix-turn-helix [Megasphaera paucivorans]